MRPLLVLSLVLATMTSALAVAAPPAPRPQGERYVIYDGLAYKANQLELATRSPVTTVPPQYSGSEIRLTRSADAHYYVHATLNGFPLTFMIDTGASMTAIPINMARNAGLRSGLVTGLVTAGGRVDGGFTQNNQLDVGPIQFHAIEVAVMGTLPIPLLGMNVLRHFQIGQEGNVMLLRAIH